MKLFVLFVFCLASVIEYGSTLECYKCENCDKVKPDTWEKISCGVYDVPIPPSHVWTCLTIDFKNKTTSQEEQVRKCVLAEKNNGDLTFNCPITIGEIRSCKICQKDFCV